VVRRKTEFVRNVSNDTMALRAAAGPWNRGLPDDQDGATLFCAIVNVPHPGSWHWSPKASRCCQLSAPLLVIVTHGAAASAIARSEYPAR